MMMYIGIQMPLKTLAVTTDETHLMIQSCHVRINAPKSACRDHIYLNASFEYPSHFIASHVYQNADSICSSFISRMYQVPS